MQKCYAAYEICPTEIAIFDNEEDRNNWLAYKDVDGDEFAIPRLGLTPTEAHLLAGDALDDESQYIEDEFIPGVRWLILHDTENFNIRDFLFDQVRDVRLELERLRAECVI